MDINFIPLAIVNRFEFCASLRNLACNSAEATKQRLSGIKASETCVYKSFYSN
uniref:Uncharacterized protein n=1 Tax=Meloidogyne enterolobii TaxID=390850 RepID=A0A6V7WCX6_MELEN|nr:unnamed protein product [Meloidogyne enterolobii]